MKILYGKFREVYPQDRMGRWYILMGLFFLLSHLCRAQETTGHPRLLVTSETLAELKTWAVSDNPFYTDGIKPLAEAVLHDVYFEDFPNTDNGGSAYTVQFTEGAASLLAFMSMIEPDQTKAEEYRTVAIQLLMYIIDIADLGVLEEGTPEELRFRRRSFSTSDRSRWIGSAFPLTVDWLYGYFSTEQKKKIRRVFIRWAEENLAGYPNHNYYRVGPDIEITPESYNSEAWLDLEYDPIKKRAVRYAMNNYFNAHIRNIVMMGASFDVEDDIADPLVPGDYNGRLREYREKFIHTWHYMADYAYRYENNGGVSAEGGLYMPALGFTMELLVALHTAGYDPEVWGEKIDIDSNPHWERMLPAILNSLPPERTFLQNRGGWCYQPSWFGDGEHLQLPDVTSILGYYALYSRLQGREDLVNQIRWALTYTPPGSQERILSRINNNQDFGNSILNFLVFDPESAREAVAGTLDIDMESVPLSHFAPGTGRFSSRTSWDSDLRWFNYRLGWSTIDHQHGDGNMFDFYRKGEWLTKERTGYGNIMGSSDYKNTLTIKRDTDEALTSGFHALQAKRGSQLRLVNAGDPEILQLGANSNFAFVTGDATNLYNYSPDWGDDVTNMQHVSRSIMWLKPDYFVIYDRVESNYEGFKRSWLNLPSTNIEESENRVVSYTPKGQKLIVTDLLPENRVTSLVTSDTTLYTGGGISIPEPYPALYDPMGIVTQTVQFGTRWDGTPNMITLDHPVRLMVEAEGNPTHVSFLRVLEGADGGASPKHVELLRTSSGIAAFEGAVVDSFLVLFPRVLDSDRVIDDLSYVVPNGVRVHYITGLKSNFGYSVTIETGRVSIHEGGSFSTDQNGILGFTSSLESLTTGVDPEVNSLPVRLWPNPATSEINLMPDFAIEGKVELGLYNLNGALVKNMSVNGIRQGEKITMACDDLQEGVYVLQLVSKEILISEKIIISK